MGREERDCPIHGEMLYFDDVKRTEDRMVRRYRCGGSCSHSAIVEEPIQPFEVKAKAQHRCITPLLQAKG